MSRLVGVLALSLVSALVSVVPAMAETPSELADELAADGVYVASSRTDIDEASLEAVVQEARFQSLRVAVVAPLDPQPDASAFARRIQEATTLDAAIVFPPPGTDDDGEEPVMEAYVVEDLSDGLLRALRAGRAESDPAMAVSVFTQELTVEVEPERPAIFDQLVAVAVALLVALGLAVAIEQGWRRSRRQPARSL